MKVRSQYHMNKTYRSLPAPRSGTGSGTRHVGLIGCGKFAYAQIAYYLSKGVGSVIRGAMDVELERAASLFERYDLDYYTDDPDRVLTDDRIDLVYIASNHASHAEYAIRAIEAGKAVHVEKPHVVSVDQLERLCAAIERHDGRVRLGFNRPTSAIGEAIHSALAGQDGATMMNWFIAGHELPPGHWYFAEEEGGRVLGNLCHWTDFVLRMVPEAGRFPIVVTPTRADRSDVDIAMTYVFGDGSIAAITFSAKGHTFEGVRERFAAHKGNVLLTLDDFHRLEIDTVDKRRAIRPRFRDHGHREAILRSYAMSLAGGGRDGGSVDYIWNTGRLFLATKQALDERGPVAVEPYSGGRLKDRAAHAPTGEGATIGGVATPSSGDREP